MIEVPASFAAMPRWWADEPGAAWVRELPSLVAARCRRWGLVVDGPVMHGSNALVVPVRRSDVPFALRLAPPGDDVEAEVRALRTWAGRGVVQLIDADPSVGATLLERLDGTRTLAAEPLAEAVEVIAGLARSLAVPVSADVESTAAIARQERDRFTADRVRLGRPAPERLLDAAVEAAEALASDASSMTAVDGDLHFGQVLRGRRAPWIVVDPVLLRGDPEYDLGRVLWSRLDEVERDDDVVALFETFVRVAAVPPERARRWVVVRAMSYLLWGLDCGLTDDPPRCRRLLDVFG